MIALNLKNKNNTVFLIVASLLLIISFTGIFENKSIGFLKSVSENNLKYLGLVSEIKLILASVSSTEVPFISGETNALNEGLNKSQNYLIAVNIISFTQLMLLTISKSILLKIVLVILFVLSLLPSTKVVSSKLLILALALNPGLSMFSVIVQQISQEATISFGAPYLNKLDALTDSLRSEKANLMQEYDKRMTEINNGSRGVKVFSRLREDISYDVQKLKVDISGDYSHLRMIIRDAGDELFRKLFIFCTSVLFCQLLLPIGYIVLIAILFKSLFPNFNAQQALSEAEAKVQTVEKELPKV